MPSGSASMWPREYGAYGELAFPLIAALVIGAPGIAAWGLTAAAFLFFLAHEPLLIARGIRGERRRRETGRRAAAWFVVLGGAATIIGIYAFRSAPESVRIACVVPAMLGAVAFSVAALKLERTLPGQLVAALALTSPSLPVALASAIPTASAALLALVWALSFCLTVFAVRGVTHRTHDQGRALRVAAMVSGATAAGLSVLVAGIGVPAWPAYALIPSLLVIAALLVRPPSVTNIRRVGWSLIGTSVATLLAVVWLVPS